MLLQVVLPFERLPAGLTSEGDVILVRPLVDHKVIRLGESALAVLADELTFGPHFATKFPTVVGLNWHYGEHRRRVEWRPVGRHTGKRCIRCVLCSTSDFCLHSERQIIPTPCVWESNLGQHAETYRPAAPSSHNSPAGTTA